MLLVSVNAFSSFEMTSPQAALLAYRMWSAEAVPAPGLPPPQTADSPQLPREKVRKQLSAGSYHNCPPRGEGSWSPIIARGTPETPGLGPCPLARDTISGQFTNCPTTPAPNEWGAFSPAFCGTKGKLSPGNTQTCCLSPLGGRLGIGEQKEGPQKWSCAVPAPSAATCTRRAHGRLEAGKPSPEGPPASGPPTRSPPRGGGASVRPGPLSSSSRHPARPGHAERPSPPGRRPRPSARPPLAPEGGDSAALGPAGGRRSQPRACSGG